MDYLRRLARITQMDRIRNETIRTKMCMMRDITGNRRKAIRIIQLCYVNGKTAELLDKFRIEPQG
jgi:hypothetical protein